MKKVIPTTWLKAITTLHFLMIIIFTSSAQESNWEIGIGLRPLNLEDDPYSLILKRHFTPHFALRFGLGGGYREKSSFVEYLHPYVDTIHQFTYQYTRVDKNFYISSFLGIQYFGSTHLNTSKQSFFDWYLFSDLMLSYKMQKAEIPDGIFYLKPLLRPGDDFFIVDLDNRKEMIVGIRQGIGIKYILDRNTIIGIEAGANYELANANVNKMDFHASREGVEESFTSSTTIYALQKARNYRWGFSPVTLISVHHSF